MMMLFPTFKKLASYSVLFGAAALVVACSVEKMEEKAPLPKVSLPRPDAGPKTEESEENAAEAKPGMSEAVSSTVEPMSFPVTELHGTGNAGIDTAIGLLDCPIEFDMHAELTETQFLVRSKNTQHECEIKGKKHIREANEAQEKITGDFTYELASFKDATEAYAAKKQKIPPFLVFAKSLRRPNGDSLTFSPPLPIILMSSAASLYEAAFKDDETVTFDTDVTSNVSGVEKFHATSTFRRVGKYTASYDIEKRVALNLPYDCRGFDILGENALTVYSIDTVNLRMLSNVMSGSFTSKNKKRKTTCGTVKTTSQVCSSTQHGKTTSFSCGRIPDAH